MDAKYSLWIFENVPQYCGGMCFVISTAMVKEFPELKRVRGHYVDLMFGTYEHWWCKTPDGEIVDPTVSQFTPDGQYVE
jgi:hypothetical protein